MAAKRLDIRPGARTKVGVFRARIMVLPKGLTRAAALKLASQRATRDFRGFEYDSKTGRARLL